MKKILTIAAFLGFLFLGCEKEELAKPFGGADAFQEVHKIVNGKEFKVSGTDKIFKVTDSTIKFDDFEGARHQFNIETTEGRWEAETAIAEYRGEGYVVAVKNYKSLFAIYVFASDASGSLLTANFEY